MNLRRGLAAGAGIFSAVALGIALEAGDPASAFAPPPDGNYSFNQAGVSGVNATSTVNGMETSSVGTSDTRAIIQV